MSPITKGLAQSAIQAAIVTLLKADAGVAALVSTRIYDAVPEPTAVDYIAVGEWTEESDDTLEDGDAGIGSDCTVTIHTYTDDSRDAAGYKKCQAIASAVKLALHGTAISVTGWTTVTCEHEDTVILRDETEAGRPRRHGISTYRIQVEG